MRKWSFRLPNIEILTFGGEISTIPLIWKEIWVDDSLNIYSVIIWNNGTGKSTLLWDMVRGFEKGGKQRMIISNYKPFKQADEVPGRIIALSCGLSDKFPVGDTYKSFSSGLWYHLHADSDYVYLWTRNRLNSRSSKALLDRAFTILIENCDNPAVLRKYSHVFDYLNYNPRIKITYRISQRLWDSWRVDKKGLEHYIESFSENENSLKRLSRNRIAEIYLPALDELVDFMNNEGSQKEYEIDIDILWDSRNYRNIRRKYELLSLLTRINIVRRGDVFLQKKWSWDFEADNMSSGETNIIATFLSLVPLVTDGSLILIDEPEISLHPLWQSQYIGLVDKILEGHTGCHIIIATHSHFLISDLPVGRSSVTHLQNDNGVLIGNLIKESTYGWSSEDILLNVFGLPTDRNYYLSLLVTDALEMLAKKDRDIENLHQTQAQLKIFYPLMKDEDPLKRVIWAILKQSVK